MKTYDLIVAGGGIAGSVTARFAADAGLHTLLVEKRRTPRDKACSGLQLPYFERLIGDKIPPDRLCAVPIEFIEMHFPDGRSLRARFPMLSFMRKDLDAWLNDVARQHGAEFRDRCSCQAVADHGDRVVATLVDEGGERTEVSGRYLVDATGLNPAIRRLLRPGDFRANTRPGGTLNYYLDGELELDRHTLYQFWNLDWNNTMFAWVYTKTVDGKDYWVVGTGCNDAHLHARADAFFASIAERYQLRGQVAWREGYVSPIDMGSGDFVWLGEGRILMAGDAAGLVDLKRGVGMDAAAQSGRILARVIATALRTGGDALALYGRRMQRLTAQVRANQRQQIVHLQSNDELQAHLDRTTRRQGLATLTQAALNRLRPVERVVLLPT